MPYKSIADLPKSVRDHLPKPAQKIYKEAFNHALDEYSDEVIAHRVAWSAVKKSYHKTDSGEWKKTS